MTISSGTKLGARRAPARRAPGKERVNQDSYQDMLATVQAFHDKHRFRETGGEELAYRVALMTEELGEISACVTKGKNKEQLAEECADLFILILGTAIAADLDLRQAFWDKMKKVQGRESRMINGRIRVSEFKD
ncbi:MazG nucleotide pyrophosphohydrolase domain-containing protein [Sulfuricaulis sp.]|jgi:NTP pyrophosphatase (non-canonical NTP hydrolase)|uniref:MazG nucleotide pyrophosphohydrolase domain-containing protein n=1 Tax=Sulfuricaulis sp. TaxID=2003553 RepID=UPI00355AA119